MRTLARPIIRKPVGDTRPFANPAEAFRQGRMVIGSYIYYKARVEVFSALRHEPIFKFLNQRAKFQYRSDVPGEVHICEGRIIAIGYDASGGCWPCAVMDDGTVINIADQGLVYFFVFDQRGHRLN